MTVIEGATLPERDASLVCRALALLDAVGGGSPIEQSAAAVQCLLAAEHLSKIGVNASTSHLRLAAGEVATAISHALLLLAELSPSTFGLAQVAAAVDAAQRAHALATRG